MPNNRLFFPMIFLYDFVLKTLRVCACVFQVLVQRPSKIVIIASLSTVSENDFHKTQYLWVVHAMNHALFFFAKCYKPMRLVISLRISTIPIKNQCLLQRVPTRPSYIQCLF